MGGTATLADIEDDGQSGTATLDDIEESAAPPASGVSSEKLSSQLFPLSDNLPKSPAAGRLDLGKPPQSQAEKLVAAERQNAEKRTGAPLRLAHSDLPEGLKTPGNIDLNNRPIVKNADGSISTEFSTSFSTDKGEVLVPTVVNGKFLTPDGRKPPAGYRDAQGKYHPTDEEAAMWKRARQHYEDSGEHMGIFDTPEHADAYAEAAHNRGQTGGVPVTHGSERIQPYPAQPLSLDRSQPPVVTPELDPMATGNAGRAAPSSPETQAQEWQLLRTASGIGGYPKMARGFSRAFPRSPLEPQPSLKDLQKGGTEMLSGAGEALTPVAIGAALVDPAVAAAVGIMSATGAYSGKKITQKLGGSPEAQDLAEAAGGWLGGMAGGTAAGVGRGIAMRSRMGFEDSLTEILWNRGYITDNAKQRFDILTKDDARAVAREVIRQNPASFFKGLSRAREARETAAGLRPLDVAEESRRNAAAANRNYDAQQAAQEEWNRQADAKRAWEDNIKYPGPQLEAGGPIAEAGMAAMQQPPPASPQDQVSQATSSIVADQQTTQAAKAQVAGISPAPPPPAPAGQQPVTAVTQDQIESVSHAVAAMAPEERAQAMLELHQHLSEMLPTQGQVVGPDGQIATIRKPEDRQALVEKWMNAEVKRHDDLAAEVAKAQEKQAKEASKVKPNAVEAAKSATPRGTASVDQIQEPGAGSASVSQIQEEAEPGAAKAGAEAFTVGDKVKLDDGRAGTVAWTSSSDPIVRVKFDDGGGIKAVGVRRLEKVESADASTQSVRDSGAGDRALPAVSGSENAVRNGAEGQSAHKFNSSHVVIPAETAKKIKEAANDVISEKDLAGKGRETEPHVTLKYGVKDEAADLLREKLAALEPFEATLGKIRTFPPSEASEGTAPVYAEVKAPQFKQLHDLIDKTAGSRDDNFSSYVPHVTLGYIKPEAVHKYFGRGALDGVRFPVNSITIALKSGKTVDVPLGEKKVPQSSREAGGSGTEAGAKRDTGIMARLEKEHPEWSLGKRLQEAARLANPPKETKATGGAIIFARHGATQLDKAGSNETVAGWTSEPLDERGIAAAEKMAVALKDRGVTQIVSSDLARSKQTAEIVGKALNLPVKTDARLRPQHVPETEGLKIDAAKKIWDELEAYPDEKPEGGESWNEFKTRQQEAIDEIEKDAAKGEVPLVMSHSRNLEAHLGQRPEPGKFVEVKAGEKLAAKGGAEAGTSKPPSTRGKQEIDRDIDALVAKGKARREASKDQSIRGLRPADTDWMSEDELAKLNALQLERHPYTAEENSPELARARVAEKRAARAQEEITMLGGPPKPGEIGQMRVSGLTLAPHKFQYKLSTDAEGVSTLLKDTKTFNPDLAGIISVWRDPVDGKTYVVNGHHRFELAKRTGQKWIAVRHIVAASVEDARAIGARQNIAEGRGTAVDAAKFFRDTSITPADLEKHGISLTEKTAADGLALSNLEPSIFAKVVSGDIRQGRAIAIGEATSDHAEQKAILVLVDRKERGGGKVSDSVLSELIRLVKGSEQTQETTSDLFGAQQISRSLALEKAEISDYIKQQLGKDKKLFGFVAKEGRAEELARAGNKIDVEKSKEISTGAAQAEEVYNKLSSRGGPIATILDESARRLADGENAGKVKSEAYQSVRAEVSKTLGGNQGPVSQGLEEGTNPAEAQPLFKPASGSIQPSDANKLKFEVRRPGGDLPTYLRLNPEALTLVQRAQGHAFGGVNLPKSNVGGLLNELDNQADELRQHGFPEAARKIFALADALLEHASDEDGLTVVGAKADPADEIKVIHEELYHAAVQRRTGLGTTTGIGVPVEEMASDPGVRKLSARIRGERRGDTPRDIIVAEAAADLAVGTYDELTPEEAEASSEHYYTATADRFGLKPLEAAQRVFDYVDTLATDVGIIQPGEQFNVERNGPNRRALARVLASRRGTPEGGGSLRSGTEQAEPPATRGRDLDTGRSSALGHGIAKDTSGTVAQAGVDTVASAVAGRSVGQHSVRLGESNAGQRTAPSGRELPEGQNRRELEGGATRSDVVAGTEPRSGGRGSQPTTGTASDLHAAATPGLSDEELAEWQKSKGFRTEDAGEQLGMFGEGDKVLRAFRTGPKGKEQSGLVYQSQLDKLKASPEGPAEPFALTGGEAREEQPRLFGAGDLGEIIGPRETPKLKTAGERLKEQVDLFRGEAGEANLSKLREVTKQFYDQDVKPTLEKAGLSLKEIPAAAMRLLYPRIADSNPVGRILGTAAPSDAVDTLMRLKGDRGRALAEFNLVLGGLEKMFDHLSGEQRIDFIDRLQTGEKQLTQELRDIAQALKEIQEEQRKQETDAANLERKPSMRVELPKKENYFHNRWKIRPGANSPEDETDRLQRLFTPRRPLEGSKGYNKQQKYTLKSGIAKGGEPYTTNPISILRARLEDGMKFITAKRAEHELKGLDLWQYLPKGKPVPEGFDRIDDRAARVYYPVETASGSTVLAEGGQWIAEANTARLLNNMLSMDLVRGSALGRGLMWVKNSATAIELGLSPFHAVFETLEAMSSQLSLGMLRSYNLGVRGGSAKEFLSGIKDMLESPVAPMTMAREGAALPAYIEARSRLRKIGITEFGHTISGNQPHGVLEAIKQFRELRQEKAIQRLLKRYPDLDQLVDDLFTGGLNIGQHRDYRVALAGKTATEAWTEGNPIGAVIRSIPTALQGIMYPLFQWYIPNLKYSLFLRMMSEQAAENAKDLESGKLTRAELARRVADSVENRFGELNFDNLFWNRSVKSTLQFIFRSATYKLGTVREFAGATGGQARNLQEWAVSASRLLSGGEEAPGEAGRRSAGEKALPKLDMRASWVMSLLLTTAVIGALTAKALTKRWPWEWTEEDKEQEGKDLLQALWLEFTHPRTGDFDTRGKPSRVNLPTYIKEVEQAAASPVRYLMSSFSTILSKGIDIAENKDFFGNYVYNPNDDLGTKATQAFKYAAPEPFSISNYERGKKMGETTTAWLSAFGFPRAKVSLDFTKAEQKVYDIMAAKHTPSTPEQETQWEQKREAFEKGELSASEARTYIQKAKSSWLEYHFKHDLEYKQAVEVYDLATDDEKSELRPLLNQKRFNLLKKGRSAEAEE